MPRFTRHLAHWPPGVPATVDAPNRNLCCSIAEAAERVPDKTAIDYYGRALSYAEFHQAVLNLAGYLQQRLGVRRGDRVLLLMQNCPQFAIAYYAILRCDAVVVALNPMSTAEEVAYYVHDSGGTVLIAMQELQQRCVPLLADGRLTGLVVGACSELAGRAEDAPFMKAPDFVLAPRRQEDDVRHPNVHDFAGALAAGIAPRPLAGNGGDLAVIGYTSGTTGSPKGAMLTHRNIALMIETRKLWFGDAPGDGDLVALPVVHVAGQAQMNQALCQGRTMVLLARWDAAAVPRLIERHRIARWAAVTPMLVELMDRPELAQHDISSLQRLYGGATAMPESVAREVERRFGVPFIECYGMTETAGSSHMNPPQAPRLQCGGIPQVNVDARVIDPASGAELAPGEQGEIVMHSPMQFAGYWGRPEATRNAFIEIEGKPFVRSGDLGHYDEDGYFYITDRLKRMINASGLKVWPAEIEACLHGHPAVQEACVISARDPRRGETVKAVIVLKPAARGSVREEDIVDFSRGRLAAYKVPRVVDFVDSLPRTAAGKLMWRVVQEQQDARDGKSRPAPAMAGTL